jgi:hypothetical protein
VVLNRRRDALVQQPQRAGLGQDPEDLVGRELPVEATRERQPRAGRREQLGAREKGRPVHLRHLEVRDDDGEVPTALEQGQRGDRVVHRHDFEAIAERAAQDGEHRRLVVHA